MALRRNRTDQPLLDERLTRPPTEPRPPREPREPTAPGRSPLSFLSDANDAMWAGGEPAPPGRMRPPEDQAGYVLCLAMVILGIVLTIVHGKGSPKHPQHWIQIIGLVIAFVTPLAIFRRASRFLTAILVIIAALLISLVPPPRQWEGLYYLLLIGPLGYAFWLTRRQSKAARALNASGARRNATTRGPAGRETPKRGRRGKIEPEGPPPNRRYTPPKGPRQRPKRSELAAAPQPALTRRQRRRQAADEKAARKP